MPPSAYRTAINNAIGDWNAAPSALGTTWPSWRKKSQTSIDAVTAMQQLMVRHAYYDDELVALVEWLLDRPNATHHYETKLANGTRLKNVLTTRLSTNPAPRLNPQINARDVSVFRYWTVVGTPPTSLMYSSHGIYLPDKLSESGHALTFRPRYTYYFYCDPGQSLKYSVYRDTVLPAALQENVGERRVVDSSGETENLVLICLESDFFYLTTKTYTDHIRRHDVRDLAFLSINKVSQICTFQQLDTQLLPHLNWPVERAVHMIVCRAHT